MNANTIILWRGKGHFTRSELIRMKQYDVGLRICGVGVKHWSIDQIEEARTELAKHKCKYGLLHANRIDIEEWLLEFCECDEDGEFVEGSDYEPAEGEWPYEVREFRPGHPFVVDLREENCDE